MSIEKVKTIDFIGTNKETGAVTLGISDHLDWNDSKNEHLLILQEKINTYLAFIEGGQLYEEYPLANGKDITIQVIGKHALNEEAKKLYQVAGEIVKNAGFDLQFKLLSDE